VQNTDTQTPSSEDFASRAIGRLVRIVILPPILAVTLLLSFTIGMKAFTQPESRKVTDEKGKKQVEAVSLLESFQSDGAEIYYTFRTAKPGLPLLIYVEDPTLMPGIINNVFFAQNPYLELKFTTVVYDHRYTGKSVSTGPAPENYLEKDLKALVLAVRKKQAELLGIPENTVPVYIHARGLAAPVVLQLQREENLFTGIALVSPILHPLAQFSVLYQRASEKSSLSSVKSKYTNFSMGEMEKNPALLQEKFYPFLSEQGITLPLDAPLHKRKLFTAAFLSPEYTLLDTFRTPKINPASSAEISRLLHSNVSQPVPLSGCLLAVFGTEDSVSTPEQFSPFAAAQNPDQCIETVVYEKSGFSPHFQNLSQYAALLSQKFP